MRQNPNDGSKASMGNMDSAGGIRIALPDMYSYPQILSYLLRSPLECLHAVEGTKIVKAIRLRDKPILVEVKQPEEGFLEVCIAERPLAVCAPGSAPGAAAGFESEELLSYVRDWLDLDTELRPFYELARHDPVLGQVVHELYGLRIVGIPDLFETLTWAIMGQQINLTFAYTLKRRWVEAFGSCIEAEGRRYWLYPEPERIASLSVSDLKALQFTGKKSEYLLGVARLMAEGALSKDSLMSLTEPGAAEKALTAIRGIGPWTAHYALMRCLRSPSAFPVADVGLHNALKALLQWERKPTQEQVAQLFARWQGWEAYATFYLWRTLY